MQESNDTVGHGDELAYLFDAQDIHGQPMDDVNAPITKEDAKVRDFFTQMISDFARFGKINVGKDTAKPFSSGENNFIQIQSQPKIGKNFRFCEVALWVGLAQRLQSSTCQFIKVLDSQLKNVGNVLGTAVKNPSNLGGILGGGGKNKSSQGGGGVLGGLLRGGGNNNKKGGTASVPFGFMH